MNDHLHDLLTKTPGIIHGIQGLRSRKIDPTEYRDLLHMKSPKININVGCWVRVNKGIYKGDVGRVKAAYAYGVDLYLVPRILAGSSKSSLKRKKSTVIPEPKLFYPQDSTSDDIIYYHHNLSGTVVRSQIIGPRLEPNFTGKFKGNKVNSTPPNTLDSMCYLSIHVSSRSNVPL